MPKYQSVTTPDIQHDPTNFLAEIFFLNKHGPLPQYPWRKGNPLAQEWGKTVSLFRKLVKTHKIAPEQIGWYLHTYQPKVLETKSFGLMVWKIKNLFKHIDLKYLERLYAEKFRAPSSDKDHLNIIARSKHTVTPLTEPDNLLNILQKLESTHGQKEEG